MAERVTLVDHVRRCLAVSDMPITDVVVGVSGGPDSVALLRALHEVVPGQVVVAHVNHGWRGRASDEDEAFVRDLAARLSGGTPRVSFKLHRAEPFQGPGNREAQARRLRYDWLTRVAQACGITWVATGHTADDQAETVLFRLLRGTGLDGLSGMSNSRLLAADVAVIRPFLYVTRQMVLDYLVELGQEYRTDESNFDLGLTRNRIRHELLPLLARDYNPRIMEVLVRLTVQASDAQWALAGAARHLLRRAERQSAGSLVILDAAALARAQPWVLCRTWRLIWKRSGWPMGEMGYREWTRLAELARGGRAALDLPGGIRVRRKGRIIQAGPADGGM